MRVRFLNMVDPAAPFLRDLATEMAEHGHQVEVMISDAEYREGRNDLRSVFNHPNIELNLIAVGSARDKRVISRLLVWSRFAFGVMWSTATGRSVDLNYFLTQPPLLPLWGAVLRVLRRQPYAVMVMDLYPDLAIEHGVLRPDSLVARISAAVTRVSLTRARAVFVIGRCMRDRVRAKGVPDARLRTETLWVNENTVHPVAKEENELRREHQLDGFVLLYSGNIGVGHYFDDVIEVARRLKDRRDLHFVFVGSGSRRAEIESAKQRLGLDNVVLLPFQPEEKLAQSLSMADMHFISLREGFEGLMVPSKSYGAFGAGRGAIYQGNLGGEIAREITELELGTAVPPGDPDRLEAAILDYYEDPERARRAGNNALAASQTRFARAESTRRYRTALEELV